MSLNILTVSPENGNNFVTIDTNIVIELTDTIDPFTVANGVNLYTEKETTELVTFSYQINDKVITITPETSLEPDTTYFINVFPGNDASRYISKRTTGSPIVISANGSIEIVSAYTGNNDDSIELSFSSSDGSSVDTLEVYKGIKYIGAFKTVSGEVNIGELTISLDGNWDITDSISIPVYKASGLTEIYRTQFTTTKYTTINPTSHKIEYVSDSEEAFRVIRTIPEDMSIGNTVCNPIVIKFSGKLKTDQNLTDKIRIKRTGLDNGTSRNIIQYYKIEDDSLKIYMISTSR